MRCDLVLLALGLVSVADAFFFPFFNKGKGKGNSGKYPGPSKVPSHYGPPRPRPPIRPTLTYGPPRPQTTYGPPNVRPRPPSNSYGPPSKGKGTGGYPGTGGGKGDGGYPGGSGGHSGGKGTGGYPGGSGTGGHGGKGSGGYPGGSGGHSGGHTGGKGTGGYPGGSGGHSGGHSGGKGTGGYPGGNGGHSGGYSGGKGTGGHSGSGGSLNHHTHYHSHYHSTTVGVGPRETLTGVLPTLTTGLPGPGVPYTTVVGPASAGPLSPPRPTHSTTIVHTRPPHTGYRYLPPQGQASDKVATYVRPESELTAEEELISPRGAGGATARLELAELSSNLVEVGTAAGPGVEEQGPQTELQAAASSDQPVLQQPAALTDRLRQLGLLRFLALVERAGLEKVLESRGGVTVFAFTDEAWSLLPYSLRRQLSADPGRLRQLLLHHVTPLAVPLSAFNDNMVLKSASPSGATLRINIYQMSRYSKRVVTVNGAQVLRSDASSSSGGVIHVLDKALVAEAVLDALQYVSTQQCADLDFSGVSNMLSKLGVSQLLSQQAPLTLFLPISAAFSDPNSLMEDFSNSTKVMQNSLLYHMVPGTFYSAGLRDGQWLETLLDGQELELQVVTDGYTRRISTVSKQAQVIRADIPISNGVIHIVDFVLRPERNLQRCDVRR
ncbi:collagen alpha-3(V) chain-like [Amphibalanus amphitrite]|uniref:collagen alpha-3(V) chain-like n=2 Tax=Amphibalanus amphitrite TaxID=1232801 RepID=UPI001C919C5C|nr:collagen alpha-3(V) chain-like [Amphibalanus amphitrite]